MSIQLSDNIRVGQRLPLESKYFNGTQPYTDVTQAETLILTGLRHQGLTVNIAGVEYWFKDGIANGQLVIKNTGSTPSGAALTKVDDTNVTLTLGGSPNTALLAATSITVAWTGTLADSRIASATNWNSKQNTITLTTTGAGAATFVGNVLNIPTPGNAAFTSLTTTGSSGSSTLSGGVLNVPTYTLAGLGGITLTSLSSTATGLTYTNTTGVFSLTSGYLIPTTASYNNTNWDSAFTNRITSLTTTGTSGAATLIANTLNIPQYQAAGTYVTSVTGTSPISSTGGTTPVISIPLGTSSVDGYLSAADRTNFQTAYTNRITSLTTTGSGAATLVANVLNIPTPATATFTSLTVTGNSGASTLSSGVLNVPTYTLSGLGGQPLATNLTSLAGLTYAATSFVKMTAAGVFALDTNTYLTSIPTLGQVLTAGNSASNLSIALNQGSFTSTSAAESLQFFNPSYIGSKAHFLILGNVGNNQYGVQWSKNNSASNTLTKILRPLYAVDQTNNIEYLLPDNNSGTFNVTLVSSVNGSLPDSFGNVTVSGNSPLTTKGDLYTRSSSADTRLTVGTPGQILSADPAEVTGLKWITFTGGGGARVIAPVTADITGGTAAGTDYVYLVNQTTLVTVTLPAASGNTNSYTIKKIGTGEVRIATTAGTIDGSSSPITINVQNVSITLVTDGTNWFII